MIEYFTEGIVLKRHARGEYDGNIIIYTKDLGKISTYAKSIRKITSKISGHMMPGNIVQTRIIEKNNIQAVDALGEKTKCDSKELLDFLDFIDAVIPVGEPDIPLWHGVKSVLEKCDFTPSTYAKLLEILGFGGEDTRCNICGKDKIAYFSVADIIFLCDSCAVRAKGEYNDLIAII